MFEAGSEADVAITNPLFVGEPHWYNMKVRNS